MPLSQAQTKFAKTGIRFLHHNFCAKDLESELKMTIVHSTEKKNMPYNTHIKKESCHFMRQAADSYIVLSIIATA